MTYRSFIPNLKQPLVKRYTFDAHAFFSQFRWCYSSLSRGGVDIDLEFRGIKTFGDFIVEIPKMVPDDREVVICITGEDNREFLEKISVGWFWYLMDKYEKPKNYEVIKTARIEKCKLITVETRMTFCVDLKMVDIIDACLKYNLSNDREWNPSLFKTLELKRYEGASNEPDFDGDTFTIVDAKKQKIKNTSIQAYMASRRNKEKKKKSPP